MEKEKTFYSFNQDCTYISIGNKKGFLIYQVYPLIKISKRGILKYNNQKKNKNKIIEME